MFGEGAPVGEHTLIVDVDDPVVSWRLRIEFGGSSELFAKAVLNTWNWPVCCADAKFAKPRDANAVIATMLNGFIAVSLALALRRNGELRAHRPRRYRRPITGVPDSSSEECTAVQRFLGPFLPSTVRVI
jgi:hypothetical protein